ncbi:MAG: UTP--glucose-1-phosphate uridylyltransferase [Chlamydiales bacterium]|nr:UTP--glucose-1-phosphate uridylyltransferase [Chlamydiales bacterium]
MDFEEEIAILTPLVLSLKRTRDLGEKQEILLSHPRLNRASEESLKPFFLHSYDLSSKIALFSLVAIGQEKRLFFYPEGSPPREKLRALIALLTSIERFYESIGGIAGYHLKVLQLLAKKEEEVPAARYTRAPGIDLACASSDVEASVAAGIEAIPEMGEIYPIGGLGSRLNLISKSGEPLPAACLPFLGTTLLHGLIRDLQAREFLYYRLFGKQVTMPVAMMTSLEKKNALLVRAICEKNNWFSRPKESFFLFSQLSVPVVSARGEWVMRAPLEPLLEPGGHGALWRTAEEEGVFNWFLKQGKHRVLIRQINNPIGGVDHGLLALAGVGKKEQKTFGFASCERLPDAAEGVLVMKEEGGLSHLSNIEYTDFKKYGIEGASYPANTNILYADIKKLQPAIKKNPLPGLILNMKDKFIGGRLESMMQNITDALPVKKGRALPTFLTYNERRRTISAAKRSFEAGHKMLETPEGAFYDLLLNSHTLLREWCSVVASDFSSPETYLKEGPSNLFLYHPALGPLYSLIAQKIHKGRMADGAELQLEIADLKMESFDLEGSLRISARNIIGHLSQGILRYSQKTGKCVLRGVKVRNEGICRSASNTYWKNQIKRQGALNIVLEGHSEFYAEDVVFEGERTIVVPDGERWIARKDGSFAKERAGWEWHYKMRGNQVFLSGQHFS